MDYNQVSASEVAHRGHADVLAGADFPYEYEDWSPQLQVTYETWRLETLNVRLAHGDAGVTNVRMVQSLIRDSRSRVGPGAYYRSDRDSDRIAMEAAFDISPLRPLDINREVPSVVPGGPSRVRKRRYAT